MLLTLAILESDGFAIRYRELLIRTLSDQARARLPFDYYTALSDIHEDTRRAITADSVRSFVPAVTGNPPRNTKGQQRQRNGRNGKQTPKCSKAGKGKKGKGGGGPMPSRVRGHPPLLPPRRLPLLDNRLFYIHSGWRMFTSLSPIIME